MSANNFFRGKIRNTFVYILLLSKAMLPTFDKIWCLNKKKYLTKVSSIRALSGFFYFYLELCLYMKFKYMYCGYFEERIVRIFFLSL